jgi:hypothetical protein
MLPARGWRHAALEQRDALGLKLSNNLSFTHSKAKHEGNEEFILQPAAALAACGEVNAGKQPKGGGRKRVGGRSENGR